MKKEWLVAVCLFLFLPSVLSAAGEEKKDVKFFAKEPDMLTSAGQSADVQMVKVLLERSKIAVKMSALAGPDDLLGAKTLVMAVGGSAKGLGAAGVDADKEAARVQKLLAKAKEMGVPILSLHLGGTAKRGELSDRFIGLVMPVSACVIALKDGDKDGFITKTSAKGNVPVLFVDKISQTQEPLKTIFGK
jgi:dihydroorotase-like cyclic amidohydrolase